MHERQSTHPIAIPRNPKETGDHVTAADILLNACDNGWVCSSQGIALKFIATETAPSQQKIELHRLRV